MHKLRIKIGRSGRCVECPRKGETVPVHKACIPRKTMIVDSCIFFRGIDCKETVEYVKCSYSNT